MAGLKELVGPFFDLTEKYIGIKIDPFWGEVVVGLSILIFVCLGVHNLYLWVRRRFGDISALPEEQLAVVNLIARDVKGIKEFIELTQASLNATITGKLEEALFKIKQVDNDNAAEEESGAKAARENS
jgi:hypothetical protein